MAADPLALPPGTVINEYCIESTLGVGGFGLTYLATDANLKLRVAIKEYLPGDLAQRNPDQSVQSRPGSDEETFRWGLERFLDESRTLASFRHPNIVRVMRFFQANSTAYMVMEFVDGDSLSDWVKARRPLDEAGVRQVLLPLLDGLEVVHQSGFLHRDIKPGNIFIRADGSPVLLDFGSARATTQQNELTAIVTPGYAPLEQYHTQGRQGPWSDLYALGGVLYWMVTGNRPVEAAARVGKDPLAPALQSGDRRHYSNELLAAIDWMLTPDEAQRPQAVAELKPRLGADGPATVAPLAPRTPAAAGMASSSANSAAPSAPTTFPTAMVLDRDAVKKLELELSQHIGPIAAVLVRKAAVIAPSVAALARAVAGEIDDEAAKQAFLKHHARASSDHTSPSGAVSAPSNVATQLAEQRFGAAVLDKAEKALAQHLGPLARVVVKRAAMKARDVPELYLIIADEIEDREQRKAFVRKGLASRD